MKVVAVAGARPNFMKVAPILQALSASGHEGILVHTGQHYDDEMSAIFFRELGIPEPALNLGIGGGSHGEQTARMLEALERALREEAPDAAVLERERVRLFERLAMPIAPSALLPEPNMAVAHDGFGIPLLLTRDKRGEAHVFWNVCRHRGTRLVEAGEPHKCPRIVCPYHAWTYDLEGRLVATPRRMETPDFQPQDFPLHGVAAACWGGFVFVHLGTPRPLEESLANLPERFERYRFPALRIGKRIVLDVQANWSLLSSVAGKPVQLQTVPPAQQADAMAGMGMPRPYSVHVSGRLVTLAGVIQASRVIWPVISRLDESGTST